MKLGPFLKQAVLDGNWNSVCQVYTAITGEPLEPPQEEVVEENLADIEIPDAPSTKLSGRTGKKKVRKSEEDFIAPSKGPNRKIKKEGGVEAGWTGLDLPKIGQRPNRFTDDQRVAKKDLVTEHPELGVAEPTPRSSRSLLEDLDATDTGSKVYVECALCHNNYSISLSLAHGYSHDPKENVWRCNTCSTQSGRRALQKQQRM